MSEPIHFSYLVIHKNLLLSLVLCCFNPWPLYMAVVTHLHVYQQKWAHLTGVKTETRIYETKSQYCMQYSYRSSEIGNFSCRINNKIWAKCEAHESELHTCIQSPVPIEWSNFSINLQSNYINCDYCNQVRDKCCVYYGHWESMKLNRDLKRIFWLLFIQRGHKWKTTAVEKLKKKTFK